MRYVIGVLIPTLLQCFVVLIVVVTNTGNGSWVGLGIFILSLFSIPATALANIFHVRAHSHLNISSLFSRGIRIAIITPFIVLIIIILL